MNEKIFANNVSHGREIFLNSQNNCNYKYICIVYKCIIVYTRRVYRFVSFHGLTFRKSS